MPNPVYWPHIANNAYTTVINCFECALIRFNTMQTRNLRLFQARSSLAFIAMDLLCLWQRTTSGKQYSVEMPDCYTKPDQAGPISSTSTVHVASIFYDHYIKLYDINVFLLTNNGTKICEKVLQTPSNSFKTPSSWNTSQHWHMTLRQKNRP